MDDMGGHEVAKDERKGEAEAQRAQRKNFCVFW